MIDRWIEQGKPLCGKNVDIFLCSSTADLGVQITYFNKIANHYVLHLIIFYSGQTIQAQQINHRRMQVNSTWAFLYGAYCDNTVKNTQIRLNKFGRQEFVIFFIGKLLESEYCIIL